MADPAQANQDMQGRPERWRPALISRYKSPAVQSLLFVVLVGISVFSITAWRIERAYYLQLGVGRSTTANLARSLADQAHATIHSADTIVSGLAERLEIDGSSDAALTRVHRLMDKFVAATPSIRHLVAFSADGEGLVTSIEPMPKVNVADRSYFIYHRDHSDTRPLVGAPIQNRADGSWSFTLSRRIDNPDGSFGGAIVAVIDCEAVNKFYRDFDIGPNGTIWLMNEDATLLVRQPPIPDAVGKNFEQAPTVQDYRERGPIGNTRNVAQVDHVARLTSFRKVDDYPLVIFVSVSEADILQGWYSDTAIALGAAAAVSLVLALLAWRLVAQRRLRDSKDSAIKSGERLYRLITDHSTDIIIQFDDEGHRRYVSPAAERVLGYRPSELANGHPRDTVHPEDWARVAASMAEVRAEGHAPPISYRVRRKDGLYVWVETQSEKLGGDDGYIATIRDISSRKRVEDLLHQANNHLQRMVMLDGLTGIGNRRAFDATLSKEFRRSARSQLPLALLMIDVDYFKKFNDLYGHPAGDTCLKSIAEAVDRELRRPADFVARYGGEEFAVILPDTNSVGAAAMAERIRHAVELLAIAHEANPASVATISIGVAAAWPQAEGNADTELLELADAALYVSKTRGRNRIHLHETETVLLSAGERAAIV